MASTNVDIENLLGLQQGEFGIQSYAVTGGTLYITFTRTANGLTSSGVTFVPTSTGGGLARYLNLTDAKSDLGVPLTATAGTPTGAVGVSRTAGTSLVLSGEATSSNAKTDKAFWETNLPSTYIAGANIALSVNSSITGTGTLTGASCTITAAAYTEVNGVETALTVSAAQQIVPAGSTLIFTITGTGLTPGAHISIELTMLITSASGANTGQINSVSYVA
jgi:hypothetical protein